MNQELERGSFQRHRHAAGYAAVVLSGGYVEIGDTGRWNVEAGDVVYHAPFEAHGNVVSSATAIINVPTPFYLDLPPVFRVKNPDDLLKATTEEPSAIAALLRPHEIKPPVIADWPDLLALALLERPICLGEWAEQMGLRPETVSRGFQKAYATSAARYRLEAQTRAALKAIVGRDGQLADIASHMGFSDQAHMSRAILALTGRTPGNWRKVKSVQALRARAP